MDEEWGRKGATLSDKTVRKEDGPTQDEILAAIDAGQLRYRVSVIHGNPCLRLLRRKLSPAAGCATFAFIRTTRTSGASDDIVERARSRRV